MPKKRKPSKLCIKACPTNALFWKAGMVGIIEELCIYCGACVLNCIVDDCIKIVRKDQTVRLKGSADQKGSLRFSMESMPKNGVKELKASFRNQKVTLRDISQQCRFLNCLRLV
jgi:Na+-translocating ferredoxin:NAD+ oxidoreductase RNF subunit RnfB